MSGIRVLSKSMTVDAGEIPAAGTKKKTVWEYDKANGKHSIRIFALHEGIFAIKSTGIAYKEGSSLALDFIIDACEHTGKKIRCLLDNSELFAIDCSFKLLFLRFPLANECLEKIATYGDNLYVQSFGRIYQSTFGMKFKIRSFRDKSLAVSWLSRRE